MNRKFVGLLTLAASFTMVACDSDSVLDLSGELTELESQELSAVLLSTTLQSALVPQQPAPSGPALTPFSFSSAVDGAAACALGGDVNVTGEAMIEGDDATNVIDASFGVVQVHRDCVVEGDDGKRFTLNGSPSIEADFNMFTNGEGGFEMDGSLLGAIQWESDGLAGVCEIAVEYSAGGSESSGHFSFFVEGTVCGFSVSHQGSYGDAPVT